MSDDIAIAQLTKLSKRLRQCADILAEARTVDVLKMDYVRNAAERFRSATYESEADVTDKKIPVTALGQELIDCGQLVKDVGVVSIARLEALEHQLHRAITSARCQKLMDNMIPEMYTSGRRRISARFVEVPDKKCAPGNDVSLLVRHGVAECAQLNIRHRNEDQRSARPDDLEFVISLIPEKAECPMEIVCTTVSDPGPSETSTGVAGRLCALYACLRRMLINRDSERVCSFLAYGASCYTGPELSDVKKYVIHVSGNARSCEIHEAFLSPQTDDGGIAKTEGRHLPLASVCNALKFFFIPPEEGSDGKTARDVDKWLEATNICLFLMDHEPPTEMYHGGCVATASMVHLS